MNDINQNQDTNQNQPYAPHPSMDGHVPVKEMTVDDVMAIEPSDTTTPTSPITPQIPAPVLSTTPAPVVSAPAVKRGSKSKWKVLAMIVLALIAIAGAGMAYWQHTEATHARADKASAQDKLTTATGTISTLNAKVETLTKEVASSKTSESSTSSTSSSTTQSDQTMITTLMTAYDQARTTPYGSKLTIVFNTIQSPFARVTIGSSADTTSSEVCTLKKANNTWMILYCGTSATDYSKLQDTTFSVPSSLSQ